MVPIESSETAALASALTGYDARATITHAAALLTVPHLQANAMRLEVLVHLAAAKCAGRKKPKIRQIEKWLNDELGRGEIAMLEDPAEDVFVSNVRTPEGNRRIFEGLWESNDYYLQATIDILMSRQAPQECRDLLLPALALLRISDTAAERLKLGRWHVEPSSPRHPVKIEPTAHMSDRTRAVTFTDDDLVALGITRETVNPFVLRATDREALSNELTGDSSLEKRPLIAFSDALVLSLPSAVSVAIRRFALTELRRMGYLPAFEQALARSQGRELENVGLRELKEKAVSIPPPPLEGERVSLHSWLLSYDQNKYIHVVLLHDKLQWLDDEGLANPLTYPEPMRASLDRYLQTVAERTHVRSDCSQGMTLVVIGGLGRGVALGLKERLPRDWSLSVISLPDLLMLAMDRSQPVKRYLKCVTQKAWVERQGVVFLNPNGDFNLYGYWRQTNHQLVPRELAVGTGSLMSIGPDFVFSARQYIRTLVDPHAVRTRDGSFVTVVRFGLDAYFTSDQRRPIYASLTHIGAGTLAGIVGTSRGATWLIAETGEAREDERRVAFELWSGFLGLFDTLVTEVEAALPQTSPGVMELRLDLRDVRMPESDTLSNMASGPSDPEITVDADQGVATIRCPPGFLANFQRPENIGERLTVRAMANSLFRVHLGADAQVADVWLEAVADKVVGADVRILHLFATNDIAEYLSARALLSQEYASLPHEDFVFSKLGLTDGCTLAVAGSVLRTKDECNTLLHKVATKVWGELRNLLRQLDRGDVLRQLLSVHEGIIRDRDRWRRTAKAVIALHASSEDVVGVARTREEDRNNVALPVRTIIEMAVCESPESGGRAMSQWDLDALLARGALLLEVATDSDAIYAGLIVPEITVWANGEYTLDRPFYEGVIQPFVGAYLREGFLRAADDYAKLYRTEGDRTKRRLDELFASDFIDAFSEEFRLTPDEAIKALGGLIELAAERNNVIVETTVGDIRHRLMAQGLSTETTSSFVRAFTLFHRPRWDEVPAGFSRKDLSPWRYGRRLSVTVRPLLAFGESDDARVLYGLGTLCQGFAYLLDRTERGQMPGEFFSTERMKIYLGTVNHRRGLAFAESVAKRFRTEGWQARTSVRMTELGAPSELGDIDVLAWNAKGNVEVIECKRLQLARTVAEIAEVCRRFRGEAKDELARHIRRINWIKQNPSGLRKITGFHVTSDGIDTRVVTNTHVPMRYLQSLPIQAEKIGPLDRSDDA